MRLWPAPWSFPHWTHWRCAAPPLNPKSCSWPLWARWRCIASQLRNPNPPCALFTLLLDSALAVLFETERCLETSGPDAFEAWARLGCILLQIYGVANSPEAKAILRRQEAALTIQNCWRNFAWRKRIKMHVAVMKHIPIVKCALDEAPGLLRLGCLGVEYL